MPAFLRFIGHPEPVATAPAFDPTIGPYLAHALSVTLEDLQAAIRRSRKGKTAATKLGVTPVALRVGLCEDWGWIPPAGAVFPPPYELLILPRGGKIRNWSARGWQERTGQSAFANLSPISVSRQGPSPAPDVSTEMMPARARRPADPQHHAHVADECAGGRAFKILRDQFQQRASPLGAVTTMNRYRFGRVRSHIAG